MMPAARPAPLAGMLAAHARNTPEAPALHVDGMTRSYAALADETARRASALAALRLPPASVCALAAPAGDLAATLLACQWAGHPFLPLDPTTADERWPAFAAAAPAARRLIQAPAPAAGPLPPATVAADDVALIVATSGSEGAPKGVLLPQRALVAAATASAARIPLAAGDTWLACLPLFHIGGLSIFWRCFAAGAAVRLHEGFDATAVWADIAAGRATHVSLVPAMLARLLDVSRDAPPPSTLACALIGGAALSRPLWRRARNAGWPLYVSYGMSETAAQVATLPPTDDWDEGLVGTPLPGMEIAIGDDGHIRVRGPQLMQGYLALPANGAAAPASGENPEHAGTLPAGIEAPFENGWLRTGDLGHIDAAGHLRVLGRGDDVLVSGGENIHPLEIESRLAACPGVTDVAVTATPDPVWGDLVTALVVGSAGAAMVDAWSRAHLPAKLRPRKVIAVAALPRNALGKLERRRLPELLAGGGQTPMRGDSDTAGKAAA